MATLSGRNCSVKLGATLVEGVGTWSLSFSLDEIDATSFGSDWKKSDVGFLGWTASFNGYYDNTDSGGTGALLASALVGTKVTTLRFYEDSTNYWTPNTGAEAAAGGFITGFELSADKADIVRISWTMSGTGPIHLTS